MAALMAELAKEVKAAEYDWMECGAFLGAGLASCGLH
jgi:hypothetical protein